MEIMETVTSKESIRLVHPFTDFLPEHIQIFSFLSKNIIAEEIFQARLAKIFIRSALQIQRFRDFRARPIANEGCVHYDDRFGQESPQKLLLPESSIIAAANLNPAVVDSLIEEANDEIEKLALELEPMCLSGCCTRKDRGEEIERIRCYRLQRRHC